MFENESCIHVSEDEDHRTVSIGNNSVYGHPHVPSFFLCAEHPRCVKMTRYNVHNKVVRLLLDVVAKLG